MLSILTYTWANHDHGLLLLAAAIWVCGSFSLFMLLQRSLLFGTRRRRQWAVVAATTGGIGVWSTHFVAMLAHRDGGAMSYHLGLTILSIVEVTFCFWAALRIAASGRQSWRAVAAGGIAALGVAAMHFTGMAAAEMIPSYVVPAALRAVIVSALCFVGAFWLFARTRGWAQLVGPALLAVFSVCLLHFAVMASTSLRPCGTALADHGGLGRGWLTVAIVAATGLLGVATAVAMLLDRYLTDLRGFAEATLEGIAIVRGDAIVEANARFAELIGAERAALPGASPAAWLAASDGRPLLAIRDTPGEALLVAAGTQDRVFEIATHRIEYRGRDCVVLALRDVTEKQAAQRRIEHLARHDALTDLPNRMLFDEQLHQALLAARRGGGQVALIALDLDRFKTVNDLFGHAAGDAVLCRVGKVLRQAVRSSDLVARIGGDEFVILQTGVAQPDGARALSRRILAGFAREMDTARDPAAVGVSIGVALFPDDADDGHGLRHGADMALYRAKQAGRGRAHFFDATMDADARERRALDHDLRHAILRGQIAVAFQPLVCTATGRISGYEALMRWDHPERGEVPPATFIPIAEESGAILPLGEHVLRAACTAAAGWDPSLFLAVNVSPIQFQIPNLAAAIEAILTETGFPAARLELEITESALLKDRDQVLSTLVRLKRRGVRIVMDDFGTGFSSLSNLQNFPFDKIKIDRSFVAAMADDAAALSIIRAIVGIGRSLALPVVAEGVETEAQRLMVIEEGCPLAQGYLFGRPERGVRDGGGLKAVA